MRPDEKRQKRSSDEQHEAARQHENLVPGIDSIQAPAPHLYHRTLPLANFDNVLNEFTDIVKSTRLKAASRAAIQLPAGVLERARKMEALRTFVSYNRCSRNPS